MDASFVEITAAVVILLVFVWLTWGIRRVAFGEKLNANEPPHGEENPGPAPPRIAAVATPPSEHDAASELFREKMPAPLARSQPMEASIPNPAPPQLGLWESFISNRAGHLKTTSPGAMIAELNDYVSHNQAHFNQGLSFLVLAQQQPVEFSDFVRWTMELRKKHGSDWDQVHAYYEERNQAFRDLFMAAAAKNPTAVSSVHDVLVKDMGGVQDRTAAVCRLVGEIFALRDALADTFGKERWKIWWQWQRKEMGWDGVIAAVDWELRHHTHKPILNFGKRAKVYKERIARLDKIREELSEWAFEVERGAFAPEFLRAFKGFKAQSLELKRLLVPKWNAFLGEMRMMGWGETVEEIAEEKERWLSVYPDG